MKTKHVHRRLAPITLSEGILFAVLIGAAALVKHPDFTRNRAFTHTAERIKSFLASGIRKQPLFLNDKRSTA